MTTDTASPAAPTAAPTADVRIDFAAVHGRFTAWLKEHEREAGFLHRLRHRRHGRYSYVVSEKDGALHIAAPITCGAVFGMAHEGRFEDYLRTEIAHGGRTAADFPAWRTKHQSHGGLSVVLRDTHVCLMTIVRCACGDEHVINMD